MDDARRGFILLTDRREGLRLFRVLSMVFPLLSIGCSCNSEAAEPMPAPPKNSQWREQFGMPAAVAPEQVAFADPAVRDVFLQFDAAARKMASDDWAERPGDGYPYLNWNSGSDGYQQTYLGKWSLKAMPTSASPGPPNQNVSLQVTLHHKPRMANGFLLLATRDEVTGWSTWFSYNLGKGSSGFREGFQITFSHPTLHPLVRGARNSQYFRLGPAGNSFETVRTDDRFIYSVKIGGGFPAEDLERTRPVRREMVRYWLSAESFRQAALEELDRFEAHIRTEISSGRSFEVTTRGGPTGATPPMPVSLGSIPAKILDDVLGEAVAQVERRKQLVRNHYIDMHAAAVATFPSLAEIVGSANQR